MSLGAIVFIFALVIIMNILSRAAKNMSKSPAPPRPGGLIGGLSSVLNASKINSAWMSAAGQNKLSFLRPETSFDYPSIGGRVGAFEVSVRVDQGDAETPPETVYRVVFPEELGIGLLVMRDSQETLNRYFSGRKHFEEIAGKLPDGVRDFALSAYDKSRLAAYFSPKRRAELMSAVGVLKKLRIDDKSVSIAFPGVERDPEKLSGRIKLVLRLASVFGLLESVSAPVPATAAESVPVPSGTFSAPSLREPVNSGSKPFVMPKFTPFAKPEPPPKTGGKDPVPEHPDSAPETSPDAMSLSGAKPRSDAEFRADGEAVPSVEELAEALFSHSFAGAKEKEFFETVKGKSVCWSGTVRSAYDFGADFVFGNGGGVKTTLDILEIKRSAIPTKIRAVVCFPRSDLALLRHSAGGKLVFSGTLLKFEAVSKEIYLASGQIVKSV